MTTKKRGKRANNEGTIYQRADGRWVCSVVEYKNGIPKRVSHYAETQAEARQKLTALKAAQDNGVPVYHKNITFAEWLNTWLSTYIRPMKKPRTWASYHLTVEQHIKPVLGKIRLKQLRTEAIQGLLNTKCEQGMARTAEYIRAVLRAALNKAIDLGYLGTNPAVKTEPVTVFTKDAGVFSEEEAERFLVAAGEHRLAALFWLALGLGLRKGELTGLKPSDVDHENKRLYVRRTIQFAKLPGAEKQQLIEGTPKSERSKRPLPIPDSIYPALVSHLERREQEKQLAGSKWKESGYLFTSSTGTAIDPPSLSSQFHDICGKAKVPLIRFHDLRHSCGTLLHSRGAQAFTIQQILGHSQISTTRRYTQVQEEIQRDAMNRMFEGIKSKSKPGLEPEPVAVTAAVKRRLYRVK